MSKKKSLFADAVTDAKELKETALANAKLALAESFAPKVQSMINSKLNEMEDELDENFEGEEEKTLEEILNEMEGDSEEFEDETTDVDVSLEDSEETEDLGLEDEIESEENEEVVDLTVDELKNVIRDVMAELDGNSEDEEIVDLEDESEEDIISLEDEEEEELDMVAEEDLNLDEILAEIEETHQTQPSPSFEVELNEAKQEISKLKQQLKENNLLLAKSIFLNKILKANTLSESKKVAVINAFDRVSTVKEARNTFETLKESLSKSPTKVLKENKGFASKAAGVSQKEILTEAKTDEFVARMQKLAGIN